MIMLSDEIIESSIHRGSILHSYMFKDIGHGKFFVVVGVSKNKVAGFFFVNSDINFLVRDNQELMNLQYLLKKKDYPFLKYDSFLCATRFIECKIEDLIQSIRDNQTKFISELNDTDITNIVEMVSNSKAFSSRDKLKYLGDNTK